MNPVDVMNHTLSALVDSQKRTDASMDSLAVGLARLQRTLDGNKPKRVDKNPLREVIKTLEIDCLVRYRVEAPIDDEMPNCYDIEISVAPGLCLERTIAELEAELPQDEVEREEKLMAERGDDGDAKYEAYKDSLLEQKHRANAADAAQDFGMGK